VIHAVSLLRVQAEALEAAKAEGKDKGADLVLYKRMAQVLAGGGSFCTARVSEPAPLGRNTSVLWRQEGLGCELPCVTSLQLP